MARETKVGLLAGLSFIICFAVILANRGRETVPVASVLPRSLDSLILPGGDDAASRPRYSSRLDRYPNEERQNRTSNLGANGPAPQREDRILLDQRTDARESADRGLAPSHGLSSGGRTVPASAQSQLIEPLRQPAGTVSRDEFSGKTISDGRHFPGSAGATEASDPPRDGAADFPTSTGSGKTLSTSFPDPLPHGRGSVLSGARSSDAPAGGTNHRPERVGRNKDGGSMNAGGVARGAHAPSPKTTASKPSTTNRSEEDGVGYTVAAGDTLTAIARRHYGRASLRIIDAIFQANRKVLASPDVLKVGETLVLPVAAAAGETSSTLPAVRGDPARGEPERDGDRAGVTRVQNDGSTEGGQASPAAFRWYQVQPGDVYFRIAREQLGDERRWRELHDLNKGIFPDPSAIRPGVRIKIPIGQAGASESRS